MNKATALFNKKCTEQGKEKPVTRETVSKAIGIDRKTFQIRLKDPSTFRGYELSMMYRFLRFSKEERDEFNQEVTK